jgi:hypothetical protein
MNNPLRSAPEAYSHDILTPPPCDNLSFVFFELMAGQIKGFHHPPSLEPGLKRTVKMQKACFKPVLHHDARRNGSRHCEIPNRGSGIDAANVSSAMQKATLKMRAKVPLGPIPMLGPVSHIIPNALCGLPI